MMTLTAATTALVELNSRPKTTPRREEIEAILLELVEWCFADYLQLDARKTIDAEGGRPLS